MFTKDILNFYNNMKDWTGNKRSIYATLGASNHVEDEREENDFYATNPIALELLLEKETFAHDIWEPAAGQKHLSNVLEKHGHNVRSSDLIIRTDGVEQLNFFDTNETWHGDIITNPPYKYAQEFVEHSMDLVNDGNKVAMFLKIQFLEGKKRRELFRKYPPKTIYVATKRLGCAKSGETFTAGAVCYAWFVWEKGFNGDPIIKWFNDND